MDHCIAPVCPGDFACAATGCHVHESPVALPCPAAPVAPPADWVRQVLRADGNRLVDEINRFVPPSAKRTEAIERIHEAIDLVL